MLIRPRIVCLYRFSRFFNVDLCRKGFCVFLVHQAGERDINIFRVAHVFCAVGVRQFERLGEEVQLLCGVRLHAWKVEILKDVEDLDHDGATRGRRRGREDLIAAVGAFDRLGDLDLIICEVLHGHQAVILVVRGNDRLGQRAFVETVCALLRNQLKGAGVVRVLEDLTDAVGQPVFAEEGCAKLRIFHHLVKRIHHVVCEGRGNRNALARQINGRLEHLLTGHGAVVLEDVEHTGNLSRNTDRLAALHHLVADNLTVIPHHPHIRGGCCRGALTEINKLGFAGLREVEGHKPAATDAGRVRLNQAECKRCCNRRVDRVAALFDDLASDLGSLIFTGGDDALFAGRVTPGAQGLSVLVKQDEIVQRGIRRLLRHFFLCGFRF